MLEVIDYIQKIYIKIMIELAHISGKTCEKRNVHKTRDNKFGITFCVLCGRVFNKVCGIELEPSDKITITVKNYEKDTANNPTNHQP